ncbi:hypothetical protein [Mucilaginibacter kameinonensis]|uniref:hypothetical protein n=1 Tax=Mucilaginibacter kameinonensis TaxID=452286 RepID=UPI000EF8356C|nr:hypothetical protein [Mucilaginibacter kameinonensis]
MKWLFFIFILLPFFAKAQDIKKDTVLLKPLNKIDTVVYDIGHDKLYFELSQVLKYLKKYRGSNFYKKQGIALLTNALKAHVRGSFYLQDTLIEYPQTGLIDTAAIQNKYLGAMQEVVPAMLSDGYVMVRDAHDHHLIPFLLITKEENGNYIGAYTEFTVFLPDGKRLYNAMIFHR